MALVRTNWMRCQVLAVVALGAAISCSQSDEAVYFVGTDVWVQAVSDADTPPDVVTVSGADNGSDSVQTQRADAQIIDASLPLRDVSDVRDTQQQRSDTNTQRPFEDGKGSTQEVVDSNDPPEPTCLEQPVIVFEIYPLDIWAQMVGEATITMGSIPLGEQLKSSPGKALAIAMCDKGNYSIEVEAPHYDALKAEVVFDGSDSKTALWVGVTTIESAYVVTSDIRPFGDLDEVRHFTLWTGLPHQWFAPSGFPARHGNHVTLMNNGEDAWGSLAVDLPLAKEQVVLTSWWWESDFEIIRDPATHIWLSSAERWKNTIMARLESLWSVEKRVLINQFISQDGLLSEVNVDSPLIKKAEEPGDNFEYMGIANAVAGAFWATPKGIDFLERLDQAVPTKELANIALESNGLPPFMAPEWVDTTELPLGLGSLQVPIASWHQKMIAIDGSVAYVGGMNMTSEDWDAPEHRVYEPRRMDFEASTADREAVALKTEFPDDPPAKDYMIRLEGPLATDVEAVFSALWEYQLEKDVLYANLSTPALVHDLAAEQNPGENVVQAQLLFTVPKPFGEYSVLESLIRAVSRAEEYILIEDQYFRAPVLAEHIFERMKVVPGLKLIVVTNPIDSWTSIGCWHTLLQNQMFENQFPDRFRTFRLMSFDAVDTGCFFCIDEVLGTFMSFYQHSKLVVIDDIYLIAGSANQNNRSMLYDAEMSVAVFDPVWVRKTRDMITKHYLGQTYFSPNMTSDELWSAMNQVAEVNQLVYKLWDDEGFDLNLNGDLVPKNMVPKSPLYPLYFGEPDDCLITGIGEDVI